VASNFLKGFETPIHIGAIKLMILFLERLASKTSADAVALIKFSGTTLHEWLKA
jgi:hypothetical protein